MGFIHHTTGAAGATGLMAESARTATASGTPTLSPPTSPRPISAARIGSRPLCHVGRTVAAANRNRDRPIPATRFRIVKGQNH